MSELMKLLDIGMPLLGEYYKTTSEDTISALQDLILKGVRGFVDVMGFDVSNILYEIKDDITPVSYYGLDFLDGFDLQIFEGEVDAITIQGLGQFAVKVGRLWDFSLELDEDVGYISKKDYTVLDPSAEFLDGYLDCLEHFYTSVGTNIEMFEVMLAHLSEFTFFVTKDRVPAAIDTNLLEEVQNNYLDKLSLEEQVKAVDLINWFKAKLYEGRNLGDFV